MQTARPLNFVVSFSVTAEPATPPPWLKVVSSARGARREAVGFDEESIDEEREELTVEGEQRHRPIQA